jgi:hypothetical protein
MNPTTTWHYQIICFISTAFTVRARQLPHAPRFLCIRTAVSRNHSLELLVGTPPRPKGGFIALRRYRSQRTPLPSSVGSGEHGGFKDILSGFTRSRSLHSSLLAALFSALRGGLFGLARKCCMTSRTSRFSLKCALYCMGARRRGLDDRFLLSSFYILSRFLANRGWPLRRTQRSTGSPRFG